MNENASPSPGDDEQVNPVGRLVERYGELLARHGPDSPEARDFYGQHIEEPEFQDLADTLSQVVEKRQERASEPLQPTVSQSTARGWKALQVAMIPLLLIAAVAYVSNATQSHVSQATGELNSRLIAIEEQDDRHSEDLNNRLAEQSEQITEQSEQIAVQNKQIAMLTQLVQGIQNAVMEGTFVTHVPFPGETPTGTIEPYRSDRDKNKQLITIRVNDIGNTKEVYHDMRIGDLVVREPVFKSPVSLPDDSEFAFNTEIPIALLELLKQHSDVHEFESTVSIVSRDGVVRQIKETFAPTPAGIARTRPESGFEPYTASTIQDIVSAKNPRDKTQYRVSGRIPAEKMRMDREYYLVIVPEDDRANCWIGANLSPDSEGTFSRLCNLNTQINHERLSLYVIASKRANASPLQKGDQFPSHVYWQDIGFARLDPGVVKVNDGQDGFERPTESQ